MESRQEKYRLANREKLRRYALERYHRTERLKPRFSDRRRGLEAAIRRADIRPSRLETSRRRELLVAARRVFGCTRVRGPVERRIAKAMRRRLEKIIKGHRRKTEDLIGCSIFQLRAHLESRFLPGMSWANYGEWHIDHKRPCISFDLTVPEQQTKCFHWTNLQPLWAVDNLRKRGFWVEK